MMNQAIKDISLLYELALNTGKSLDIKENCEQFVKTLMVRKNLNYAAVWICKKSAGTKYLFDLAYAYPRNNIASERLVGDISLSQIFGEEAFLISPTTIKISQYSFKPNSNYAIVRLGDIGILELSQKGEVDVIDAKQLKKLHHVIENFTRSVKACLNHQELIVATKEAEESIKAKEEFLANMSHEIRTPMNAIMGMAELLQRQELESKSLNFVNIIAQSASGLLTVINDILDFSKIARGELDIEPKPLLLSQVFDGIFSLMNREALSKQIKLTIDNSEIENLCIEADYTRVKQVFLNLVSNAIKFTTEGEVSVKSQILEETSKKITIQFLVKDSGKGIAPESLELIFKPFKLEDNTISRKYGGTGLGLSIVKRLLELQGGEISVSSQVDVGSAFFVKWTFDKCTTLLKEHITVEPSYEFSKDLKVLLAEDNEFNRVLAFSVLESEGIIPDVAINGKEAVKFAQSTEYDLILMDIQMPEMDGIEAMKHIAVFSNVPVIALTANAIKGDREYFIEQGFAGYIAKPFKSKELFQLIQGLIKKKEAAEGK